MIREPLLYPSPALTIMAGISDKQLAQNFALLNLDSQCRRGEILLASILKAPDGCLCFGCRDDAVACMNSLDRSNWKDAAQGSASVYKIFTVGSLGLIAASSGCYKLGLVRVGLDRYAIGFTPIYDYSLFLLMPLARQDGLSWISAGSRSILRWSTCKIHVGDLSWLAFINVYLRQTNSSGQLQLFTFGKRGNIWEF